MKVYLAMAGYDYEGDEVMGVYSTSELAHECIDRLNHSHMDYDNLEVKECEVDD